MNASGRTGEDNRKREQERRKESFRDLRCLKNVNHDDDYDDDDHDGGGGGGGRGGLYRC